MNAYMLPPASVVLFCEAITFCKEPNFAKGTAFGDTLRADPQDIEH